MPLFDRSDAVVQRSDDADDPIQLGDFGAPDIAGQPLIDHADPDASTEPAAVRDSRRRRQDQTNALLTWGCDPSADQFPCLR